MKPRFWAELALVATFYGLYELVSGVTAGAGGPALGHALGEVQVERALGIYWEPAIQRLFLGQVWLVQASNVFYATVHFVMPVVALLWLFWKFPARYRRWRNAMAWMMGLSLVVFILDPVLPPRLLPAAYRFVDTMKVYKGAGSLDQVLLTDVGDLYAAMPSLHVAWAGWCAAALIPTVRRVWLKVLLVADPVLTTFVVLVTANHFILDVIGGLVVLAAGIALSGLTQSPPRGSEVRRGSGVGVGRAVAVGSGAPMELGPGHGDG